VQGTENRFSSAFYDSHRAKANISLGARVWWWISGVGGVVAVAYINYSTNTCQGSSGKRGVAATDQQVQLITLSV